jgi:hypothetical protein
VELVAPNEDPDYVFLVAFVRFVKEEGVHEEPLETEDSPLIASPTADFQSQVADAIVKLHDRIPRFMIPSLFLRLTRLPRIMTGKVGWRQLCATVARCARPTWINSGFPML